MKKSLVIVGFVVCIGAGGFALWPTIILEIAKREAIRKLAPESEWFSHVPSASPRNVFQAELSSPMSSVELSGCTIALPDTEFKQDTTRKALFTNDNLVIAFFGAVDSKAFALLERELNRSNVFDLVSSAYQTTVAGISQQPNMVELRRYLVLVNFKARLAPVGSDHLWEVFDRRDFKGYVSGDLAKDGKVAVEIYIKEKDQFLSAIIKNKKQRGNMADAYHVLSILSVRPNIGH